MATKSFAAIVAAMKSYIRSKYSSLDTSEGTIVSDVVISAPSREMENIYSDLSSISDAQSQSTAGDSALEQHAENISLVRKGARRSRGTVTFFSDSLPVSNVTIPAGTYVATLPSNNSPAIQFVTTQTAVMYALVGASYFNADTGKYQIDVSVEAVTPGTLSNVGSSTVTTLITPLSGISGCFNSNIITGGTDLESVSALRSRIASKWKGVAVGTLYGYETEVLAQENIDDVLVLGGTDLTRQEIGAVDIYVKGRDAVTQVDSFITYGSVFEDLVLTRQPVLSDEVISVVSSASGSISTALWSFERDTTAYSGSYVAQDKIAWVTPPDSSYGTIFVTYNYNNAVVSAQAALNSPSKNVLNTNVLVRWAEELDIDIEMSVAILDGFDFTSVSTTIETSIADYMQTLGIGEEVQQADVARIVLNVPGVDDVTLPFTTFQSSDASVIRNAQGNLEIPSKSYPASGTITINQIV